ncbi:hypothetical protein [Streptomyces sp. TLI_146]|uniref:hypothetical protein n=1 Tax=Streptomyces sp. TLI_146 TaxID=1938858 RepID=UPI000CB67DAF|nr:hypothetical protein [Streptomyces sp. TLI_146]PKV88685.1 hypothetical protein BX283_6308 [Streptomyces sp. TLI_146]
MRNHTAAAIGTAALLSALTACTATETHHTTPRTNKQGAQLPSTASKYEQTWLTPYKDTSCGDFVTRMGEHERWAMAADMLSSSRKTDGAITIPADSEISRFEKDMATVCSASAVLKTPEIAVTIYLMDPSYRP